MLKWTLNKERKYRLYGHSQVSAGQLRPGAALIVKSCDTNFSANNICITVKFFTISLWLWDYWKVVPNLKSIKKKSYIYIFFIFII